MNRSTWNYSWSCHSSPRLVFSALPLPPLLAPWVKETHSLALCLSLQPARSATVSRSLNRVVFPKDEKGRRGQRDRNKAEGEEGAEQAVLCSHGDTGRRQDSQRENCPRVAVGREQTDVSGGVWTQLRCRPALSHWSCLTTWTPITVWDRAKQSNWNKKFHIWVCVSFSGNQWSHQLHKLWSLVSAGFLKQRMRQTFLLMRHITGWIVFWVVFFFGI